MQRHRHVGIRGFTLVELLIVIVIVGIVAAIGIPRLNQYLARSYNAVALSDLQTARAAELAFFVDRQQYASTAGTGCAGDPICAGAVDFGGDGTIDLSIGPGGALETRGTVVSFIVVAKHLRGDRVYCVDSDSAAIRYANDSVGVALGVNFNAPVPVVNQDDCLALFPMVQ